MCPSLRPLKSHPGGQYLRPGRLLPSEVCPEGPFISRFRNILTHINFQSQLKTGRTTQGKRQRKRACAPLQPHLVPTPPQHMSISNHARLNHGTANSAGPPGTWWLTRMAHLSTQALGFFFFFDINYFPTKHSPLCMWHSFLL